MRVKIDANAHFGVAYADDWRADATTRISVAAGCAYGGRIMDMDLLYREPLRTQFLRVETPQS